MKDKECLFCKIISGDEPGDRVWEDSDFVCIKNKYPVAPVHLLVLPKDHIKKAIVATSQNGEFWSKMMSAVFSVVSELDLDKKGYKLVNNGAGYNHFEHEHIHILGGTKTEPGGQT